MNLFSLWTKTKMIEAGWFCSVYFSRYRVYVATRYMETYLNSIVWTLYATRSNTNCNGPDFHKRKINQIKGPSAAFCNARRQSISKSFKSQFLLSDFILTCKKKGTKVRMRNLVFLSAKRSSNIIYRKTEINYKVNYYII